MTGTFDVGFSYTPPTGTVLSAGLNQPLGVTFTPAEPDRAPATARVAINVKPAPLSVTPVAGQSKVYGAPVPTLRRT